MPILSWGVLGPAKIAVEKVIPPIQTSKYGRVTAIASRDLGRAKAAAARLGIAKAYGSYEELLADPGIDAVYIPLPNHLHVPWSIAAAEAGKHVLCEKPIALNAEEARQLLPVRDRTGKRIQEAFMVRTNPQWLRVRALVRSGRIGPLRAVHGFFSYHLTDAGNIRNMADIGGGGMLDIGCYPITTSRFVSGAEPTRVMALIERDPAMKIDRLGAVILDCPGFQASFAYSTQLVAYQRMHFFGERGRIEVQIPFNAPNDKPCRLLIDDGSDLGGAGIKAEELPVCDQYGVMADAFAEAIFENQPQPIPLEDAILNMRVIDAAFRSAQTGQWEKP